MQVVLAVVSALGLWSYKAAAECLFQYDASKLLKLNYHQFDQTANSGWRLLAAKDGCKLAAADLISRYRQHHPQHPNIRILNWHEGQLRAMIGDTQAAIHRFQKSRKSLEDGFGWNIYVDASIAFLQGDKKLLQQKHRELSELPLPGDDLWPLKDASGKVIHVSWPMNLHIVEGFLQCFGKPYLQAYSGCKE